MMNELTLKLPDNVFNKEIPYFGNYLRNIRLCHHLYHCWCRLAPTPTERDHHRRYRRGGIADQWTFNDTAGLVRARHHDHHWGWRPVPPEGTSSCTQDEKRDCSGCPGSSCTTRELSPAAYGKPRPGPPNSKLN